MATHSSILAWRIPWTETGGLQSMGLQGVRHDWSDLAHSSTGGMWAPGEQVFVLPGDWSASKNLQHQRPGDRMHDYFCYKCAHSDLRPLHLCSLSLLSTTLRQGLKVKRWGRMAIYFLLIVCGVFCLVSVCFLSRTSACKILVLQPGIEPTPPAVEVQSINYWNQESPHWRVLSRKLFQGYLAET